MPTPTPLDLTSERDSTTGLQSRRAFSRQVNQVVCDGDLYAIAVISLQDFEATAQVTDCDVADSLLVAIGRALLDHTSSATTVARTGDHNFGILTVGLVDENLTRWASPIITSVKLAVEQWAIDLGNYSLDMVAPPPVRGGAAVGSGQHVWERAGLALSAAIDDADGDDVVYYRRDDQRIQRLEKQRMRNSDLLDALDKGTTLVANQRIELVGRAEQSWAWYRLTAAIQARGSSFDLLRSFSVSPLLGRQLEQQILMSAPDIVAVEDGPVKVTVPVSRELIASRSFNERLFPIMEKLKISPNRVIFEVEEAALRQSKKRGADLCNKLSQIGSSVAISNCSGSWDTLELCTQLPVDFVTPNLDLYNRFGEASSPALRVLSSMAATFNNLDIEMIAPFASRLLPAATLAEVGFTYIERAPTIGTARRAAPPSDIGFSHP